MKKILYLLLALTMVLSLYACGSIPQNTQPEEEGTPSPEVSSNRQDDKNDKLEIPLEKLKQGDVVSIIGQKANSELVNENTIWLQVKQADGSFVVYHCQMKEEFRSVAKDLKMGDIVKVKGCFLSLMDLKKENASPLVTLYDCELS